MKQILGIIIVITLVSAGFVVLLTQTDQTKTDVRLAASIYPLAFLMKQIAGEPVYQVTPSGVEPHDYETSPQEVVRLRDMKLFVYNGGGLDAWADRLQINLADSGVRSLNMIEALQRAQVQLREGEAHDEEEEEDGDEHKEDGGVDPHIWLDPILVINEVGVVVNALASVDGSKAETYRANALALTTDLDRLDAEYREGLSTCRLDSIIVSHDAFGYLADRYSFRVIPIAGLSPQQQPSARRIGELATIMREQGIKYVFFETLISPKLSETLATEVGAQSLVLNPIEGLTAQDQQVGNDYFDLMRQNLGNLRLAMDCK